MMEIESLLFDEFQMSRNFQATFQGSPEQVDRNENRSIREVLDGIERIKKIKKWEQDSTLSNAKILLEVALVF